MKIKNMKVTISYSDKKVDKDRFYDILVEIIKNDIENDKLIANDTIRLIDRLSMETCNEILKKLLVSDYDDLNKNDVLNLLRENMRLQHYETILKIYKENQLELDMYEEEVFEFLKLNEEDDEIKKYILKDLKITGMEGIKQGDAINKLNKYDRKYLYTNGSDIYKKAKASCKIKTKSKKYVVDNNKYKNEYISQTSFKEIRIVTDDVSAVEYKTKIEIASKLLLSHDDKTISNIVGLNVEEIVLLRKRV